MKEYSFIINDLGDWEALARRLVLEVKSGMILALSGPLGAGKTTFVQALAKELGVKEMPVSPTFSLVRTYKTKHLTLKKLVHVDAYRLDRAEDVRTLGLEELLEEEGMIMCLEWPEQVEAWLNRYEGRTVRVRIGQKDAVREVIIRHP
ncbi:tRNA (adenosine(37)-N6)-threonylcarbamoyltransferase complex ATPase subunit type 1 TsaE [Patescibacteria group bacterium]|nr:tRNA (adenosine(37)-N6)-threonylcarbamoyltransferase complex ATPase subunit type 1 TsaE [Patescibacteria group bacterium]MBP9710626.1 tRNA (adenosine(37)-N6)-threonylcarbamoyltransferase complex ATPase subunit type 1 TsaE [Patescibacteria group bacterium]